MVTETTVKTHFCQKVGEGLQHLSFFLLSETIWERFPLASCPCVSRYDMVFTRSKNQVHFTGLNRRKIFLFNVLVKKISRNNQNKCRTAGKIWNKVFIVVDIFWQGLAHLSQDRVSRGYEVRENLTQQILSLLHSLQKFWLALIPNKRAVFKCIFIQKS